MDKLKMHSLNKVDENIEKIGRLFPNCLTERIVGYEKDANGQDIIEKPIIEYAIDFDMLKQELSSVIVEGNEERYQFTWPDKKKSVLLANAPIAKTLRPCREESVDFDSTENLYIEGDNLNVLKLLQETYLGKVKMIYIDPPYNTGNDFVYEDDFAQSTEEYLENSGQFDDEGNRLVKNLDSNGRFHTDWLNMIYPRLKIAKDLLTDDGIVFISIDDNEMTQLRKICDEVFGEDNFFSQVIIQSNKRGQTYKQIAKTHEYLLVYTKQSESEFNELEKAGDSNDLNLLDNIGHFNIRELRNRNPKFGKHNRPNLFYSIYTNPHAVDSDGFSPVSLDKDDEYSVEIVPLNSLGQESCWRWGKDKFTKNRNRETRNSEVVAKAKNGGGFNVYEKYRKTTYKPKSIWDDTAVITEKGTVELGQLGLAAYFDFPKPIELLRRAVFIGSNDGDIILDFFSGSATTAHAVMQLNAEDGGKRKFIMVQLPEETDENSEAYKAGYKNICEIGKERIRRAGAKIKEEDSTWKSVPLNRADGSKVGDYTPATIVDTIDTQDGKPPIELVDVSKNPDTGFRVLKLDSTNMKDVYYNPADYEADLFSTLTDNIKDDRTAEDLLFQVMLDLGVLLSSKIEESTIAGKKAFNVADGFLIACFDENVTDETIKAIAQKKPYYFVMRDSSMANDSVATNFEQIFVTYSPETVRKVL